MAEGEGLKWRHPPSERSLPWAKTSIAFPTPAATSCAPWWPSSSCGGAKTLGGIRRSWPRAWACRASRYRSGNAATASPDTVNLLALADLYNTSVDELLGRESESVEGAHDEETGAGAPTSFPPTAMLPISTNAMHAAEVFPAMPADSALKTEADSQKEATSAALTAAPASRPLSARLPRPLLFSAAWLAIVMIAAVGMSMGYAAYTWLPIIPLYCWMLATLEKDAASGNATSRGDASSRPGGNAPADPISPVAGTATSFLTASVGTQARIALVALATLVLCGTAFIFMIGWTAGCGPWGLPWAPSWYVS